MVQHQQEPPVIKPKLT